MLEEDLQARLARELISNPEPTQELSEIAAYWRSKITNRLYNTYPPNMAHMVDTYKFLLELEGLRLPGALSRKSSDTDS